MRNGWLILLFVVASPLVVCSVADEERSVTSVRIHHETVTSRVLGVSKHYSVVFPVGYDADAGKRWPVLFLFHGRGRHERSLTDDIVTLEALLEAPFVTILPDGDDGWYINSPVDPKARYQDYVEELVEHCQQHYRISDQRELRGLSGWSMGGYGCAMYAVDHVDSFGVLAPMIGLLDFPRDGLPEGQSYAVPVDRFGDNCEVWARLNPINHVDALKEMKILLQTGTTAFDRTMNENFSRRLTELRIPHEFKMLEGGHTFPVVREALANVLSFVEAAFVGE